VKPIVVLWTIPWTNFDRRILEVEVTYRHILQSEKTNCVVLEAEYYKVMEKVRRDETLARAWADFFVRSTDLMRKAVRWDVGGN